VKNEVTVGTVAFEDAAPIFTVTISAPVRFRLWLGVRVMKFGAWLAFGRVEAEDAA
jgi:hypothetical protein